MNRRTLYVILAGVGVALVAVIVLLVVLVNQNNAAAEQEEHTRQVEICEGTVADPYGDGLEAFLECLDDLKSR